MTRKGEPKTLWIVPGSDHAQLFNVDPEAYARRVGDFLTASLKP